MKLIVSYLISFPPHLNPPPPWGEELFFGSIGVQDCFAALATTTLRTFYETIIIVIPFFG